LAGSIQTNTPESLSSMVRACEQARQEKARSDDGGEDEGVDDVADLWAATVGVGPGRGADRDDRWLAETPEEPRTRRRSRNVLRHLGSQGRRCLPHVVLLATEKKHCAGRKPGWRPLE